LREEEKYGEYPLNGWESRMGLNLKVTPTENGAVITVDGYEISVTVKPVEPTEAAIPAARITVEEVKSRLAEHLGELTIQEEVEGIVIRPVGYLGREKFTSIARVIRELGGSYISAGKESRFTIPWE
jgi:hypothetical protein